MRSPSLPTSHVFLAAALGLAGLGALSAAPGDEDEVRAYLLEFADRLAQADRPEDLVAFYAADATHLDAQGEWLRTREMLFQHFQRLGSARFCGGPSSLAIHSVSFLAERVALAGGTLAVAGREDAPADRVAFVLKKTGAEWKIAASRVTSPAPR